MIRLDRLTLLGVLLESGGPISRTRLMKLLFLLRQDVGMRVFDFFPYRYGPYSWLAQRTLDRLYQDGSVAGMRPSILHHDHASRDYSAVPPATRCQIGQVVELMSDRSDKDVLNLVYQRFPEFTLMSKLGPRQSRAAALDVIFSVGYEGVSIDRFLNTLVQAGVRCLVDVRRNPISRRFGFSKTRLSGFCQKINVEYIHLPELGIASVHRAELNGLESYRRLFDRYEMEMLPAQESVLNRAKALVKEKASALLCFEADVTWCHRGRLAEHLSKSTGLPAVHLTHA
jgi:hypothetical protein